MKIPRIPAPDGVSGTAWFSEGNGKGSRPRNVSEQFRDNFEEAFGQKERGAGHTRIIYRNGQRIEIKN